MSGSALSAVIDDLVTRAAKADAAGDPDRARDLRAAAAILCDVAGLYQKARADWLRAYVRPQAPGKAPPADAAIGRLHALEPIGGA